MSTACIGIGSNLGDRTSFIELARERLAEIPQTRLVSFSSTYETEPVGPPGQGRYLNAAAVIDTQLEPTLLLKHLLCIEREAGRERREKWAARTLDLDILLYDDLILDTDELTIPHPHLHRRRFVLEPLAEIAAQFTHPTLQQSILTLFESVKA